MEWPEKMWSPSYNEPLEKAINWAGSLSVLDISKRSLIVGSPDETPESPALFLTSEGMLYLRVCWGVYYVLSSKLEDETVSKLKKIRSMALSLVNPERKLDISCALYHLKDVPNLIRETPVNESEPTAVFPFATQPTAKSEPIDLASRFSSAAGADESPTISDEEFDKILSIELPEVEYEPLTPNQVAQTLSLNIMWKVDESHYLFRSGGQLFLGGLFDKKGDWLADEEPFGDEKPLWFSSASHCESPVSVLLRHCKDISRRHSLNIMPLLICGEGCSIINEDDMITDWQKLNVCVCRVSAAVGSELPALDWAVSQLEKNAPIGRFGRLSSAVPAGYEELHFDSIKFIEELRCSYKAALCRFMNVEEPLAEKANYSLWYTPGHLFLIYACNSFAEWENDADDFSPFRPNLGGGHVAPKECLMSMARRMECLGNVRIHRVLLMNKEEVPSKMYGKILYENAQVGYSDDSSLRESTLSLADIVTTCRADDDYLSSPPECVLAMLKDYINGIPDEEEDS